MEQLLRTKLDPRVEDWVARGRIAGAESADTPAIPAPGSITSSKLSDAEIGALWEWAPIEANQEARRRNWGGNFTLEERENGIENVVTGLKRVLEDDEGESESEEEDEEGEDEMEVVGVHRKSGGDGLEFEIAAHHAHAVEPVVPLGEILRYMTTGHMP